MENFCEVKEKEIFKIRANIQKGFNLMCAFVYRTFSLRAIKYTFLEFSTPYEGSFKDIHFFGTKKFVRKNEEENQF